LGVSESSVLSSKHRWLVFSDLHIKSKNSAVCLDILRFVHKEAAVRNAGVIFLGDFWDTANTGYLNLQLLNEVLGHFQQEWKIPMAMIPGNHDMVPCSFLVEISESGKVEVCGIVDLQSWSLSRPDDPAALPAPPD